MKASVPFRNESVAIPVKQLFLLKGLDHGEFYPPSNSWLPETLRTELVFAGTEYLNDHTCTVCHVLYCWFLFATAAYLQ